MLGKLLTSKALRYLFLGGLSIFMSQARGQITTDSSANQSLSIEVSPIFPFAGNFFSDAGNNDLTFTGRSLMYRKVYASNRAFRISARINWVQNSTPIPIDQLSGRASVNQALQLNLNMGKEYFNLSKPTLQKGWRFFGAWEGGFGMRYASDRFQYKDAPDYNAFYNLGLREQKRLSDRRVSVGASVIAGVEYYFSKHFFVGTSLNLRAYLAYEFESITWYKEVDIDPAGRITTLNTFKVKSGGAIEAGIDNANLVLFTAGFAF